MLDKSKYFQYLMPEDSDVLEERVNDFIWFDKDGVLCSVPKEIPTSLTRSEVMEQLVDWDEKYGAGRKKMISVVNPHAKSTKEQRDFAAEILPKYISALAIINNSALGRMSINLYLGLKPPSFPLKIFKNAEEARSWLKTID